MTMQEHQLCLLLGSNIEPEKNLALAAGLLHSQVKIDRGSSVWETPAVGSAGPDFLNMALLVTTPLDAVTFKKKVIRPVEKQLGRVRSTDKNAPRTIDIDIIFFDNQLLDANLWRFAHRAVPVAEVLPDFRSTQGELLKDIADNLAATTQIRLKSDVLTLYATSQSLDSQ